MEWEIADGEADGDGEEQEDEGCERTAHAVVS
jgi:hypothetical protein